jgi:hypothetical protein
MLLMLRLLPPENSLSQVLANRTQTVLHRAADSHLESVEALSLRKKETEGVDLEMRSQTIMQQRHL